MFPSGLQGKKKDLHCPQPRHDYQALKRETQYFQAIGRRRAVQKLSADLLYKFAPRSWLSAKNNPAIHLDMGILRIIK